MKLRSSGDYSCISNINEVLVEDENSQASINILNRVEEELNKLVSGHKSKYIWDLLDNLLELEGEVEYIVREINQIKECVKDLFDQIKKIENKDKSR